MSENKSLVERARLYGTLDRKEDGKDGADGYGLLYELADHIEALEARVEELKREARESYHEGYKDALEDAAP